jgi:hypothetical protein
MVHKRSFQVLERQRMWREAFYDSERAEVTALNTYPMLDIRRGEVLKQALSYVNPSLLKPSQENFPSNYVKDYLRWWFKAK